MLGRLSSSPCSCGDLAQLATAPFKALVDRSGQCERARLPVPVSAPLDEIANVVRWPKLDLPDLERVDPEGPRKGLLRCWLTSSAP